MSMTAADLRAAKAAGTFVHVDPSEARAARWIGTNWRVEKVNPTTVSLVEDGTSRRLKAHHELLIDGPVTEGAIPGVVEVPIEPIIDFGSVVRFRGDLYVVTGQSANGFRLFALGGSSRYYRGIGSRMFEVLSAEQIAAMKAAL